MFQLRLVSLGEPTYLQVVILRSPLGPRAMCTPEPVIKRLGHRVILRRPECPRVSSTAKGKSLERATPNMPTTLRARSSVSKIKVQKVTGRPMILEPSRKFSTRYGSIPLWKFDLSSQSKLSRSTLVARSFSSMQVYTMSPTRSPFLQERRLLAKPGRLFWRVEGTSNHTNTLVPSSERVSLAPKVPWRSAICSLLQPVLVNDTIG